jgi:WD40 repeat protein
MLAAVSTPDAPPSLVATLAGGPTDYQSFSWSPDGAYLYVSNSDDYKGRVYDRLGRLVIETGSSEGWLDATHLIDGQARVWRLTDKYDPPAQDVWPGGVVANGHGVAAVIVSVPGCVGDPTVAWYKDGRYDRSTEQATPFGWSADGRLLLKGHFDCSDQDAASGWKGRLDVVDATTSHVLVTLPHVRGRMAFNASATRLAAQLDQDLQIVDLRTASVDMRTGVALLGWADEDRLFALEGDRIVVLDLAGKGQASTVAADEWSIPSPAGQRLIVNRSGKPVRVEAADGTTLIQLPAESLTSLAPRPFQTGQENGSGLTLRNWSPDGHMLALEQTSGGLLLYSVNTVA